MPTQTTTLFSLQKVKDYLKVTGAADDGLLTLIADGVSDRVEQATGRKFVTRNTTQTCDARGKNLVELREYPVASVTSVKRRATMDDAWETIGSPGYEFDERTGWLYLKSEWFYSGPRTAEIVFVAGFGAQDTAALPADVVQVALDFTEYCYKRRLNSAQMAGTVNIGNSSMVIVPDLPRDMKDALKRWQKVRL